MKSIFSPKILNFILKSLHLMYLHFSSIKLCWSWRDDSVVLAVQAWQPEFHLLDTDKGRKTEPGPQNCPLTSTHTVTCTQQ